MVSDESRNQEQKEGSIKGIKMECRVVPAMQYQVFFHRLPQIEDPSMNQHNPPRPWDKLLVEFIWNTFNIFSIMHPRDKFHKAKHIVIKYRRTNLSEIAIFLLIPVFLTSNLTAVLSA